MPGRRQARARLRRVVGRYRRRLRVAAALAAAALVARAVAVPAGAPAGAAGLRPVVVAARDLPGGVTLAASDLSVVRVPAAAVADGTADRRVTLLGRTLATPLRRGEPVTDLRLFGGGVTAGLPPGTVATPVRLADPGVAAILAVGDVVDVVGAGRVAAREARVVALLPASADPAGEQQGPLLVVATTTAEGVAVATAQAAGPVGVLVVGSAARLP